MLNALFFIVSAALGFSLTPTVEAPNFGAALPGATAVFETSLAAPITSSATSLTLTANAVRGGGTITGYNCLTIDEGSAQHEVVCGTVSGTSVTSVTRGISFATGTTTDSDNQFVHRRGANVKITDFPVIQILKAQNNGEDTFPNILSYASHPTFVAITDIIDKKYVDDIAFSGAAVIDATTAARGVVEIATQAEAAASTANGGSGLLALPASMATSTWNTLTAASRLVMTGVDGLLDQGFLPTTISKNITLSGNLTFTGTHTGINGNKAYYNTSPTAPSAASTTIFLQTITGGTLSTNNYYETTLYMRGIKTVSGVCSMIMAVGYNGATTTIFSGNVANTAAAGKLKITLAANNSASAQRIFTEFTYAPTTTPFDNLPGPATTSLRSITATANSASATGLGVEVSGGASGCYIDPDFVASQYFN